jgi:hypothetical protein
MDYDLAQSRIAYKGMKPIYLVRVARAQRLLLLTLLVQIATLVTWIVVASLVHRTLAQLMNALLFTCYFSVGLFASILTFRLVRTTGLNIFVATFVAAFSLIPYLGILALALVNGRALKLIQEHRVRVGFLGIPASEMYKLVLGACPACGYDVRALEGPVCPECGGALRNANIPPPLPVEHQVRGAFTSIPMPADPPSPS